MNLLKLLSEQPHNDDTSMVNHTRSFKTVECKRKAFEVWCRYHRMKNKIYVSRFA